MKDKVLILFSIAVGVAIFSYIIKAEAGFNMIAYAFFLLFNPNNYEGKGIYEHNFIMVFDCSFSMGIAYCLYRFLKEMTR